MFKTLVNVSNVNNLCIVFVLFCLGFYVPVPVFKENYNFLRFQWGPTFSKGRGGSKFSSGPTFPRGPVATSYGNL